jgi:aspartate/tyrosine/aromatic aminotransferase
VPQFNRPEYDQGQWDILADKLLKSGHVAFFDAASVSFGSGDSDALNIAWVV